MSVENKNIDDSQSNVNINIDGDMAMRKIREELRKSLSSYRNIMLHMAADAPIGTLGIRRNTEKELLNAGCLRIYDLLNRDFTEIEGLSVVGLHDLTSKFNQFVAML